MKYLTNKLLAANNFDFWSNCCLMLHDADWLSTDNIYANWLSTVNIYDDWLSTDNIYDRAYQQSYKDTFQSTVESSKAHFIEVQCDTELCGPDARAKAEEEAREQADANRQKAIEQATEDALQIWRSDLTRCLPFNADDCIDVTKVEGCTFASSIGKCIPTSIAP